MPVEVFPGASQPSRRNPSEVRSATDSSNSARNVRQSVSGLCKPKRSTCVNYSKSSGVQLGYDNKDHMQLAYTHPETSHLPDDFSLRLVYSPSCIRSAAAVLICVFNTTSTSFQPSSELLTELRPRRPRLERLHRAPTTSTTDHVDHVSSGSTELRPPRPPRPQDYVAMMIAAKNGATTIATTVMKTGRKTRGPDNFIANDTSSHLSNIATRRLLPPVVNKAKYYF
jgi:hypothetical protein